MRHARGFTLVELLVVFAILGLLLGLAPMAFERLREGAQYRDAVRGMTAQLRAARHRALSEGREVLFAVDLDRHRYGSDDADGWRVLPRELQLRAVVAGGPAQQASGVASIRFLPGGGASGGSVELIRSSGAGTRLRVDWLSGRVTQEGLLP